MHHHFRSTEVQLVLPYRLHKSLIIFEQKTSWTVFTCGIYTLISTQPSHRPPWLRPVLCFIARLSYNISNILSTFWWTTSNSSDNYIFIQYKQHDTQTSVTFVSCLCFQRRKPNINWWCTLWNDFLVVHVWLQNVRYDYCSILHNIATDRSLYCYPQWLLQCLSQGRVENIWTPSTCLQNHIICAKLTFWESTTLQLSDYDSTANEKLLSAKSVCYNAHLPSFPPPDSQTPNLVTWTMNIL